VTKEHEDRYAWIAERILSEVHGIDPPEEIDLEQLAANLEEVVDGKTDPSVPDPLVTYVPLDWQEKKH
jgi:hypothetical protein